MLRTAMTLSVALVLAGCGGEIGSLCPTSGQSTDCNEGRVCTFVAWLVADPCQRQFIDSEFAERVCLRRCQSQSDCAEGERCREIQAVDGPAGVRSCTTVNPIEFESVSDQCPVPAP